jgi:hypothetical protein
MHILHDTVRTPTTYCTAYCLASADSRPENIHNVWANMRYEAKWDEAAVAEK